MTHPSDDGSRGRSVPRRLIEIAALLAVVAAVLIWGAVADGGLVRPVPDTGAAVVPHNGEAYIYELFGLDGYDRKTLEVISKDLVNEGYRVNLLRDSTEGTGSPWRNDRELRQDGRRRQHHRRQRSRH